MTDPFPPDGLPPARFSPEPPSPGAFPSELHDLLDGRLDDAAAEALRQRIAAEPALREAWDELRTIQTWVREDGPRGAALEPPVTLHAGIRARLAGLVAEGSAPPGDAPAGGAPAGDPAPEPAEGLGLGGEAGPAQNAGHPRPARPSVFLRTLTLSYAAAALVVVGLTVVYVASMSGPQPPASEQASVEVPEEGFGNPGAEDATLRRLEKQGTQDESRAAGGLTPGRSERDDLDAGEGLARRKDERAADRRRKSRTRGARPEPSGSVELPAEAAPPTGAPRPTPTVGVGGGNKPRGRFATPGGAVQPKIRAPSDEPVRPLAAEAPAPRRSKSADGEALDDKSSSGESARRGRLTPPAAASPPVAQPAGPRADPAGTTPLTGAVSKTKKAPTYAGRRGSGAEKKTDGTLGRLERYLAAGDTIYVLETTDPTTARRDLAALLDAPADGAGGKATKPGASGAPAARKRPFAGGGGGKVAGGGGGKVAGGGGAKARVGASDRLYRVQAAELASLGKRLELVVSDSLRVHSTLQREQTADVLARLRSRLTGAADGQAVGAGRRRPSGGRKALDAAGKNRQRAEKPAANSEAEADGDEEVPARGVEQEEAKGGAPGPAKAQPWAKKRTPRVRILIIKRAVEGR